jgi:hypothetical protein
MYHKPLLPMDGPGRGRAAIHWMMRLIATMECRYRLPLLTRSFEYHRKPTLKDLDIMRCD